jgi:hypothetical protein
MAEALRKQAKRARARQQKESDDRVPDVVDFLSRKIKEKAKDGCEVYVINTLQDDGVFGVAKDYDTFVKAVRVMKAATQVCDRFEGFRFKLRERDDPWKGFRFTFRVDWGEKKPSCWQRFRSALNCHH